MVALPKQIERLVKIAKEPDYTKSELTNALRALSR
jgi:hypothetical protein